MGYSFADVISQASAAVNSGSAESQNFKYPIVYPGVGKTVIKLLFNPASNSVMRVVRRHTLPDDKTKVICNRTFPDKSFNDCPVCKILGDIKDAKGIDLFKYAAKFRGIAYAQFISSTYPTNEKIKPNDVVLFMFPWKVYRDISSIFNNYETQPDNLEKIVASNAGPAFIVSRDANNQYTAQIDGLNIYRTCQTDDEFARLLEGLESLEKAVVPNPPTEEQVNSMVSFANELRQKFLEAPDSIQSMGQYANQMTSQSPQPSQYNSGGYSNTQYSAPPNTNQSNPSAGAPANTSNSAPNPQYRQASNQNNPPCFGQQTGHDANECLMCPAQIPCIAETEKLQNLPL